MVSFNKIDITNQTTNESKGLKVTDGVFTDAVLNNAILNKAVVDTKAYGKVTVEETFSTIAQKIEDIQFLVDSGDTLTSIKEVIIAYEAADGGLKETIESLGGKLDKRINTLASDTKDALSRESSVRSDADTLANWRFNFQPKIVLNSYVDAQALIDGTVSTEKFIGDAQLFLNGVFFAAPASSVDADGYTTSVGLPPTAQLDMKVVVYGLASVANTFYPAIPAV